MNARAAIQPTTGLMNGADISPQLGIVLRVLAGRSRTPGIVSAHGHPQRATHRFDSVLVLVFVDHLIAHRRSWLVMLIAFFRISRSCRKTSFSRRRRFSSASNSFTDCPLGVTGWD